jgi:hypothetical protein
MMGSLYDALKAADVPDEKAVKAAEEVASHENRRLETKVDRLT